MSGERKAAERALRELLRQHDPAAGAPAPRPERVAAMRRAIAAESSGRGARDLSWLAASLAVLALGLALAPLWWERTAPTATGRELAAAAEPVAVATQPGREIQYTTERGTLVVWILNPNFNLPEGN